MDLTLSLLFVVLHLFTFRKRILCLISDRVSLQGTAAGEAAVIENRAESVKPTLHTLGAYWRCGLLKTLGEVWRIVGVFYRLSWIQILKERTSGPRGTGGESRRNGVIFPGWEEEEGMTCGGTGAVSGQLYLREGETQWQPHQRMPCNLDGLVFWLSCWTLGTLTGAILLSKQKEIPCWYRVGGRPQATTALHLDKRGTDLSTRNTVGLIY